MARNKWSITQSCAAVATNPRTKLQIITAANHRAAILKVEIIPQGATSATAPMAFELVKQTDVGAGSSDITANIQKDPGQGSDCAVLTQVRTGFTSEPTLSGLAIRKWGIHQQGVRAIDGKDEEVTLEANTRYGIRQTEGDSSLVVIINAVIEE